MTPRLTSTMLVSLLVRRVAQAGGNAAVLNRGDETSGAILLICMEKGVVQSVREHVLDRTGRYAWVAVGPDDDAARTAYLDRRRARDPDLWLVELDIANAERFTDETDG